MKFCINSVVLWAKKANMKPRILTFEPKAVNIITGASRTGKSAIIPIVDYCLGSEKCTIPVSVIRDACSWFGVLFDLENEQILICRREPGNKVSTGDMFIMRGQNIEIPEIIYKNTTLDAIKNILNELFSMSSLDLDSDACIYRPSYRDFMAFLFQPQNIVANADVLFYKADTMEHRKKLIDVFPYALGAITPEILAKRKEIERLTKIVERLNRDLRQMKLVAENWKQQVKSWLMQAHEYGLTNYSANETDSFSEQLDVLRSITQKSYFDSSITSERIIGLSQDIRNLHEQEQIISRDLFVMRKRYTDMLQLKASVYNYNLTLSVQLERLEISNWLQDRFIEKSIVPMFQTSHENAIEDFNTLCEAVKHMEETTKDMEEVPAAFERELQIVNQQIDELVDRLSAIQDRIKSEQKSLSVHQKECFTLEAISRFLGRLDTAMDTYEKIGDDSKLSSQISDLNARISKLKNDVRESDIKRRLNFALSFINMEMEKILPKLDVEHPENPVEFVIKDLSVKIKNSSGRDDYLWELGSASNWLSYHIAFFLALQIFFQTKSVVKVPNFIIFDQPSQVYFPRSYSDDNYTKALNDEDRNSVKKIFKALSDYVKNANFDIQIIVTEHAEDDIWGETSIPHGKIKLADRWRNEQKLVPKEWL